MHLKDLKDHADQDQEYQQLKLLIPQGFPDHQSQLSELCRRYWHAREHLSIDDDLIISAHPHHAVK